MINVYLAAPIRGNTGHQEQVKLIRDWMVQHYNVITEDIFSPGDNIQLTDREIYQRDIDWINQADVLIAEVSQPSHGVGYEISYALHQAHIPVIALVNNTMVDSDLDIDLHAQTKLVSAMISGNPSVLIVQYTTVIQAMRLIRKGIDASLISSEGE